jgi:hypothetical protein
MSADISLKAQGRVVPFAQYSEHLVQIATSVEPAAPPQLPTECRMLTQSADHKGGYKPARLVLVRVLQI